MRLTITLLFAVAIVRGQSPGAFTATVSMMTPHGRHTATLLFNGKVLIAGGVQGYILADDPYPIPIAELYDPSTGAFTATGGTDGGLISTATLLPDGRVLMVELTPSGRDDFARYAQVYDPSTGAFPATGDMVARTYVTMRRAQFVSSPNRYGLPAFRIARLGLAGETPTVRSWIGITTSPAKVNRSRRYVRDHGENVMAGSKLDRRECADPATSPAIWNAVFGN